MFLGDFWRHCLIPLFLFFAFTPQKHVQATHNQHASDHTNIMHKKVQVISLLTQKTKTSKAKLFSATMDKLWTKERRMWISEKNQGKNNSFSWERETFLRKKKSLLLINWFILYLPTYKFSPNIKLSATATSRSMRGLKTDTNIGPLIFTHHAMAITTNPEATIPYKTFSFKISDHCSYLVAYKCYAIIPYKAQLES